jgi:nitrogen-specific signal transduction histidine kinase
MPPDQASLWLRMDGSIMMACSTFEDWFGFSAKEMQGMSLSNLTVTGAKQLEQ